MELQIWMEEIVDRRTEPSWHGLRRCLLLRDDCDEDGLSGSGGSEPMRDGYSGYLDEGSSA